MARIPPGIDYDKLFQKLKFIPVDISKVSGTSLTGRDWSLDFAKLQNIDVLLSTRASESTLGAIAGALASKATDKLRVSLVDPLPGMADPTTSGTLIGLVGTGGRGYVRLFADSTTYTVTSTSWTTVKRYNISICVGFPIVIGFGVTAYIDTSGQTLFVRIRNRVGETMWSMSWTETSPTMKWAVCTTRWCDFPDNDSITLEAYVTGGTGYITYWYAVTNPSLVPVMGWTRVAGYGFHLRAMTVDSIGRPVINFWGRDVTPTWVHGSEVTAPAAGTALVSKTVTSGKSGYIYGYLISAGEANDFRINWISGGVARSSRLVLANKGTLEKVYFVSLNEGLPADGGSTITVTNVNAGSAGVVYQAAILYAEA